MAQAPSGDGKPPDSWIVR